MARIDITKIGSAHIFDDKNNQDFVLSLPDIKAVFDGCGSCKFSEIGSRLFAELILFDKEKLKEDFILKIWQTFDNLKNNFKELVGEANIDTFLIHNLSFTILACLETETEFVVYSAGDGYILLDKDDEILLEKLDDGEYPEYYVYNFIENRDNLMHYQDGVYFNVKRFSKEEYKNVGIATDGLRFIEELNSADKNRMLDALHLGKKGLVEKIINRNSEIFKDDISICF